MSILKLAKKRKELKHSSMYWSEKMDLVDDCMNWLIQGKGKDLSVNLGW
jgi:hypothetical protein